MTTYSMGGMVWALPTYQDKIMPKALPQTEGPKVAQCNHLVAAAYALTLNEKRLVLLAASKIGPDAYREKSVTVTVTAAEFGELYGIDSKSAYAELEAASKDLYSRNVRLPDQATMGPRDVRWIHERAHYPKGTGEVEMVISGRILLYLSGLAARFTEYRIVNVAEMTSRHSIRIYELCCQYRDTGWLEISIDALKTATVTNVDDPQHPVVGYPKFADFRRRVLDRGCREITEKSDLEVTWKPIKSGRTVIAVRFKIRPKTQGDLFHEAPPPGLRGEAL